MRYTVAAYMDTNPQEKASEDGLCIRRAGLADGSEAVMAAVCDGMGGLQRGELASAECIRALGAWFDGAYLNFPAYLEIGLSPIREQLLQVLRGVHMRLLDFAQREQVTLGTTAAVFFGLGDHFLCINVGDTRIYAYRQELCRLSRDHSLVAQEIAKGRITEEEARRHPQRNVLTQCIGQGEEISPAVMEGRLQGDMSVLICSDGYWQKLPDKELEDRLSVLRTADKTVMTDLLAKTATACRARGETDDISGILVRVQEQEIRRQGGLQAMTAGILATLKRTGKQTQTEKVKLVERAQIMQGESCAQDS